MEFNIPFKGLNIKVKIWRNITSPSFNDSPIWLLLIFDAQLFSKYSILWFWSRIRWNNFHLARGTLFETELGLFNKVGAIKFGWYPDLKHINWLIDANQWLISIIPPSWHYYKYWKQWR